MFPHTVHISEANGVTTAVCLGCGWLFRSYFGPAIIRAAEWHSLTGEGALAS